MVKKLGFILLLMFMCLFLGNPVQANNEKMDRLDEMIQFEYGSQDILHEHILRAEGRIETLEGLIQQNRALISDLKLMIDRSYEQIDFLDELKAEAMEGLEGE